MYYEEGVYKMPLIPYASAAYPIYRKLISWFCIQTISDYINQLVNFTVILGEDKGIVPANRNYNR